MNEIIQILLLGAAADGTIDQYEKFHILRMIKNINGSDKIDEHRISNIQGDLMEKARIYPMDQLIQSITALIPTDRQEQTYALAVEVCLANDIVENSEHDFLRLLRTSINISDEVVNAIHLSAKLRHPMVGLGTN